MGHHVLNLADCRICGSLDGLIGGDTVELQLAVIFLVGVLLAAELAVGPCLIP